MTDANGCTDNASVTITEPTALVASSIVDSNASCFGFADGGATASATGGTSPYTYQWSNTALTASITGVVAGVYTVTVSDLNGCTSTSSVTITEPSLLVASSVVDSNVSCAGFSDGGGTATATGGTMPYTYAWSNGAITASITGVMAGNYTVTVTDANACTSTSSITITEPLSLVATAVVDSNASCNGFADGGASASAAGGTTPYTYQWSNAATTASVTGLLAGTYTVTITDANGCTDVASATITEPAVLSISITGSSNVLCNGDSTGTATTSTVGGTTPYTYLWSTGENGPDELSLAAGTHTVTVTDANGCTDVTSVSITEPNQLIAASVVDSNVSCNGFADGGATASATGGTSPYTYQWSNAGTTGSITGLIAGTYTVTVTDANGCTDQSSVTISEPVVLTAVSVVDSNVSCNGFTDGGASATATGGTMPYSFSWSNGALTASITGVAAGAYTVTITDNNGCTDVSSVSITQPVVLVAATVVDSNASCNGFNDGGATASGTGGTSPYNYNWSNGATTAAITGLGAGIYTVTVTDVNGCTDQTSVTITEPTPLVAAAIVDSNVSCNGFLDGGASASASGGTAPYSYQWSNGGTTAAITGIAAGSYTVTVTDNNGCTDQASVTITQPISLVASTVVDSNASCNGFADGGATASATGGTTPYSYSWSNGGTTASITGVLAGVYTVTVSDANGCTDQATVTITEPAILIATSVVDSNVSCNGFADGGASVTGTGGTSPYTFLWSNGGSTASITGLVAGTYTVTLTDANGCTSTASSTITQPITMVASAVVDSNASCNGFADGGATASATGGTAPYTYLWSNAGTMASMNGLAAGAYTVTITDANGCTDQASVTITEPSVLSISVISSTNVLCNGDSTGTAQTATTGGTSPYNYLWSTGESGADELSLAAGVHTVTVTDNNGCTATTTVTISEPVQLIASAVVDSNVSCAGFSDGGATASASGGTGIYTYLWSNSATTASITGVIAGTYSVTITDANGCTDSTSLVISEPIQLVATTVVDSNVSCNGFADGGATALGAGGTMPYTYLWSNAATIASNSGLVAGTYSVTITDANGCTDSTSVTITEPMVLIASSVVDSNVSCFGFADGGATASGTGGTQPFTYNWSNGAVTASISGVVVGTYSVTVTDANGCTDSSAVTITEPVILAVTALLDSNVTCNGFSDGGVSSTVSGGTMPYTYLWSTGATTASMTGIPAGTYSVTVTDANGCTDSASTTVNEPALLVAATVVDSNVSCNGFIDGGATASASGGTPGYNYLWSNSATTASITGVSAGVYTVTVTDLNGCTDTATVTITEPALLVASVAVDSNVSCNGVADGGATASGTGGTNPYSYLWSNGATTAAVTGLVAGTYSVTLTDANGCTDSTSVVITEPIVLVASVTNTLNVLCNGDTNGVGQVGATGGTQPYTYSWLNGATTPVSTGLGAGSYVVTITDTNGCFDTTTVVITEPLPLQSVAATIPVVCANDSNGQATVTPSGGTAPYTYLWPSGSTLASDTGLPVGSYVVTITDTNGCTLLDTAVINFLNPLPVVNLGNDTALCNDTLQLDAGAGFVSYLWQNGDTNQTFTVSVTGTYSVEVFDGTCFNSDTIVVEVNPLPMVNIGPDTTVCAGIVLDAGPGLDDYLWSTTDTTQFLNVTASGNYSVVVTDSNNCQNSDTAVITVNPLPVVSLGNDTSVCDGITVDAGAGFAAYLWQNGDTSQTLFADTSGAYAVTVTDGNGCSNSDTVNITIFPALNFSALVVDATCNNSDGIGVLTVTGGSGTYNYVWSNGVTDSAIVAVAAGTYSVTVTDGNGCSKDTSLTIINSNSQVVTLTGTDLSCFNSNDGAISVFLSNGTAPFTYNWNNGSTSPSLVNVPAGTYILNLTDSAGCFTTDTVTLNEPPQIVNTIATVDANCGVNDGQASVSTTGGVPGYAYQWNDPSGQTTDTAFNLGAGIYQVTVTDTTGCSVVETLGINNAGAPTLATNKVDVNCVGGNDGLAIVTATGTSPFTYQWNDPLGQTNDTAVGLSAGTYFVAVTDSQGCVGVDSVTLVELNPLPVITLANDTSICTGDSILLDAGTTGLVGFQWSTGDFSQTIFVSNAATYTVTVTDINGCANSDSINVSLLSLPVVSLGNDTTVCGGLTLDAGPGFVTYQWSLGDTTQTALANLFGAQNYSVTVTDGNQCSNQDTIRVNVNPNPIVDLGPATDTLCEPFTYDLDAGGGFASYLWSTGDTSQALSVSTPGTYAVIVTDFNGCSNGDSIILVSDPCTGISDPVNEVALRYFPNPTDGWLTMEAMGLEGNDVIITVMDLQGQVVLQERVDNLPGTFRKQLNLSDQAQGVYFVRVTTGDQSYVNRISVK